MDPVTNLINADTIQFLQFTYDGARQPKDFCVFKPTGQLAFTLNISHDLGRPDLLPVEVQFTGTVLKETDTLGDPLVRWDVIQDGNLQGQVTMVLRLINPRKESTTCKGLDRAYSVQLGSYGVDNRFTAILATSEASVISVTFDNIVFMGMGGEFIPFTVKISPRVDECGIFAVEGSVATFFC